MRAINMSKVSRLVRYKGRDIELRLGDFTWGDLTLFHQLSGGLELTEVFLNVGLNPRLFLPAVFLHERHTNPRLTWEKFERETSPFGDLEFLMEDRDEPEDDEDPVEPGEPVEEQDPEA